MSNYASDSAKWQAVTTRDPLAACDFVYCVKTTRIFCRPICSARLARRSNVEFHDTPSLAEQAGYRACKRCRPDLPTWDPAEEVVASACATISVQVSKGDQISLDKLATASGLSKWHFHRLFKKLTGFTPKQWAARARKELEASDRNIDDHLSINSTSQDAAVVGSLYGPDDFQNDDTWDIALTPNMDYLNSLFPSHTLEILEPELGNDTSPSTNSTGTPTSLDDLSPAPIFKIAPGQLIGQLPLYYTIRSTKYGMILIGFRDGRICTLRMGFSELELLDEFHSEFLDFATKSSLAVSHQTPHSSTVETEFEFEKHIDSILEALERPSGKTMNIPLDL